MSRPQMRGIAVLKRRVICHEKGSIFLGDSYYVSTAPLGARSNPLNVAHVHSNYGNISFTSCYPEVIEYKCSGYQ